MLPYTKILRLLKTGFWPANKNFFLAYSIQWVRGGAKNVGEIKFARQRICVGEMDSPDLVTLSAAASIFGGDRPIIFITNIIYSLRNSRLREKKKRQVSPVL